jgi:hypothetical protein
MKKRSLYLLLWILLLMPTLFGVLATVVVAAAPGEFANAPWAFALFGVCTGGFAIPTVLFFLLWRKESKRIGQLEAVGAILRAYREIPIADLARQIGKDPAQAERAAAEAVAAGFAQGWVDRQRAIFYSGAVATYGAPTPSYTPPQTIVVVQPSAQPQEARYCRECGTRMNRIQGTASWQCPSCGNVQ